MGYIQVTIFCFLTCVSLRHTPLATKYQVVFPFAVLGVSGSGFGYELDKANSRGIEIFNKIKKINWFPAVECKMSPT